MTLTSAASWIGRAAHPKLFLTVGCLLGTFLLWLVVSPGLPEGHGIWAAARTILTLLTLAGFVLLLLYLARWSDPAERGRVMIVFILGLALIKLWLVGGQMLYAIGFAAHDDRLFLRLAQSLLKGIWLGSYDNLTLAKGPCYPLFIALSSRLGLPLLLSQHLLYILACATLVAALRPVMPSRLALLAVYALLLFNPMTYTGSVLRVIREGIYPAETLLVLTCVVGIHSRRDRSLSSLACWSGGLGLSLAAFWLTREEGLWLVPSLVVLLGCTAVSLLYARPANWVARLALCAAPLFIWGTVLTGACTVNRILYGVFTKCELSKSPFLAAYGALTRVEPTPYRAYIPLPTETRRRIYAVSPAFKQLEPILEGELGKRWTTISKESFPDGPAGEIAGGWFLWALRDAVALGGHCRTGKAASAFYKRVAAEVNGACDAGALPAGPRRATLCPPWRPEYGPLIGQASWHGVQMLVRFDGFNPRSIPSLGTEAALDLFRDMTHNRLAPLSQQEAEQSSAQDQQKVAGLQAVGSAYQKGMGWAVLLAGTGFLFAAGLAVLRRKLPYQLVLATAVLLGITVRILMLSMIHVSSFAALNDLYLAPAYPLLLLVVALGVLSFAGGVCRAGAVVFRVCVRIQLGTDAQASAPTGLAACGGYELPDTDVPAGVGCGDGLGGSATTRSRQDKFAAP